MKKIIWLGNSRKNIIKFPEAVKERVGYALYLSQLGENSKNTKMMKGLGNGVYEIVDDFDKDTYRCVYTVRYAETLYILHSFQKKSKSGIKTPKNDIDLIKSRLRIAKEIENGARESL